MTGGAIEARKAWAMKFSSANNGAQDADFRKAHLYGTN